MIFFEDFSNESGNSLIQRYPGTTREVIGVDIGGYPLTKSSSTAQFAELPNNTAQRTEFYMELEDSGQLSSAAMRVLVYGFALYPRATTALDLYMSTNGVTNGTALPVPLPYGVPNLKAITDLYCDVDLGNRTLTVFVNGQLVFNKLGMPPNWAQMYTEGANKALHLSSVSGSSYLTNFVKKLVIATDTPDGQMLDFKNLQFTPRPLQYVSTTGMVFSDQGYVQDVDKQNPKLAEPNVNCLEPADIVYSSVAPEGLLGSKAYPAGWSEQSNRSLSLLGSTSPLPRLADAAPAVDWQAGEVTVSITGGT